MSDNISKAYDILLGVFIRSSKVGNIKDIDDFILSTEKALKKVSVALTDNTHKLITTTFSLNDVQSNEIKEKFLEFRRESIESAKIILDYINESDTNKKFFTGYIEHVVSNLYFLDGNIINAIPNIDIQSISEILIQPKFVHFDDFLGVLHSYYIEDPNNSNNQTTLFSINFDLNLDLTDESLLIIKNDGIELEISGIVKRDLREDIKLIFENLIKLENTKLYEVKNHILVVRKLDEDFSLTLFLPKDYFRLESNNS